MRLYMTFPLLLHLAIIANIHALSSPISSFTEYTFSIELLTETADLWWNVNIETKMVTFELHMKTTGWIALGISPNGGMTGADIGLGWIDSTGALTFEDRYATGNQKPMIDNTTIDWIGLQGREEDGWTAIQFERFIDTCDSMDVPIKSGSNILIFAWDETDPSTDDDIEYHEDRRGSIVVPLLSYSQPPSQETLEGLEVVQFFATDYSVPTDPSTYYCEVFKVPDDLTEKKHAIAREIVLQSNNEDGENLVYHLSLSECSSEAVFDDENLPRGACDQDVTAYSQCTYNIVIGWGKGGDRLVEFPQEAGLPIGSDTPIKYYMLQINYNNRDGVEDNVDTSGVRLHIGSELRENDLGGLTFGVHSLPSSIAIPPQVPSFAIDSYCSADASQSNFPESGLTFFSFFGHTHSQGMDVWTKVIRDGIAVEYLFNAEAYYPDHQFQHQLLQPIQVNPGDAFMSRCGYQTVNKTDVTLGGRLPTDEMCTQVFNYYPRMDNLYTCASTIAPSAWEAFLNITIPINETELSEILRDMDWTSEAASDMKEFYDTASRAVAFGRAENYNVSLLASLPTYEDIDINDCQNQQSTSTTTISTTTSTVTTTTASPSTTTMTTTTSTMRTTSMVNNTIIIPTTTTTVRGISSNLAIEKALVIFAFILLILINGIFL